ncbi:peroxisomal membrane protein 11C-like [Amphiura filiformis]|uniref:peroxisomal membrane protein 11C-like n=1 Tax=Amphiura filiformis TaxID=82378 RepID=UPI003B2271E7
MAASKVKQTVTLLESYRGRDKIMRTIQFTSILTSGLINKVAPANAVKLKTVAGQLGLCRVILRLFDDIPMLAYNVFAGGLGQKEKDPLVRVLSLIKGCIDQLFFPVEHIAWAAENKLIDIGSAKWWLISVSMWGISLCFDIMRCAVQLLKQHQKIKTVRKDLETEHPPSSDGHDADASELKRLEEQQKTSKLQLLKDFCDLGCAIHWSAPGFLWAQKLPDSVLGLLGTMSSVLGFHAMLVQQRKQKTK